MLKIHLQCDFVGFASSWIKNHVKYVCCLHHLWSVKSNVYRVGVSLKVSHLMCLYGVLLLDLGRDVIIVR